MQNFFLGIGKLPGVAARLEAGRIFVVMHDEGAEPALLWRTLVDTCTDGRAVWVTESPDMFRDAPEDLNAPLREGMLRGFILPPGEQAAVCSRLQQELEGARVAPGSLIVIEGADRFALQEASLAADAMAWQTWLAEMGCAALWLVPRRAGRSGHEQALMRVAQCFSGLARLRAADQGMTWDVYFWFTTEGMAVDQSFRLTMDGEGAWQVEQRDSEADESGAHAVDEDEVYAMQGALPGAHSAPPDWHVFETAAAMLEALSSAHAATVVFHYPTREMLESIARPVFDLRRVLGSRLKIVVKESGGRLRHSHEQLLLTLGANLTIPSGTGFARMMVLIRTVQGQQYTRALPEVFEDAIAGVTEIERKGYLAPREFISAAGKLLESSRPLDVNNALVRLYPSPGLSVLETLGNCVMKRPGDLATADLDSVYVFLFACEEQDISTTLDRVFKLPVSVLYSDETRYIAAHDIEDALEEFKARHASEAFPDHSAALAALPDPGAPSPVPQSQTVAQVEHKPFTAVPWPLKLRTAA